MSATLSYAADPLATLTLERAKVSGATYAFSPTAPAMRAGGDLDDPHTLARVLPAAASATGEVMLLGMGGEGTMRTATNLVLNLRSMQLRHMLVLVSKSDVCERLWEVLPDVACVWWHHRFSAPRPPSLYNTRFNPLALAFFESRKLLLERLVVSHRLNVLHLDADTAWFANPYPVLKKVFAEHSLIFQQDGPFANAGVFYVQNVHSGDASAWVIEELSRRIQRFTYHPETVAELPHSGWARAPFFANADDQANLNDVLTSALTGQQTFGAGVEAAEVRFKLRFAPGACHRRGGGAADAEPPQCAGVADAQRLSRDNRWQRQVGEAAVHAARRQLSRERSDADPHTAAAAHLCRAARNLAGSYGRLTVPGNGSATRTSLLLAPFWLFAHFPYGSFFGESRNCRRGSWNWEKRTPLERRMCAPEHRVPAIAVHMAGLRQESWGRRVLMRTLGMWNDGADAVVAGAWVSARSYESRNARTPEERLAAWRAPGRLLVLSGSPLRFGSISAYDRFAGRFFLIALLLRRRPVMPPIECSLPWMQKALEPRHLRGMEVGCGEMRHCVWMPYPHHINGWCSQVDFLNRIDYDDLVARGAVDVSKAATVPVSALMLASQDRANKSTVVVASPPHQLDSDAQVLELRVDAAPSADSVYHADELLQWLPMAGFKNIKWTAPFPKRVEAALRTPPPGGLGLDDKLMIVMRSCMKSQLLSSNK